METKRHHPNSAPQDWQHHTVGVLCCSVNHRKHQEERILCGYVKATSQDASQQVTVWAQTCVRSGQRPPSMLPKLQQCVMWKTLAMELMRWCGLNQVRCRLLFLCLASWMCSKLKVSASHTLRSLEPLHVETQRLCRVILLICLYYNLGINTCHCSLSRQPAACFF